MVPETPVHSLSSIDYSPVARQNFTVLVRVAKFAQVTSKKQRDMTSTRNNIRDTPIVASFLQPGPISDNFHLLPPPQKRVTLAGIKYSKWNPVQDSSYSSHNSSSQRIKNLNEWMVGPLPNQDQRTDFQARLQKP